MAINGVILDVDGTLIDSNDAHAHAWFQALREFRLQVPFAQIRRLIGMGGDKLLPLVSGIDEDSQRGKRISARREEIFQTRYLRLLRPFPEVRRLLEHMRGHGLKLVVASSAKEDELRGLLENIGIEGLIEDKTSADDAQHSKPDPDIIEAAIERIGLPPRELVMLGDTPYDLEASRKAGVAMIALRCGGWADADFAGARAFENSPLGERALARNSG